MDSFSRRAGWLAAAAAAVSLSGCNVGTGGKSENGVFPPTTIEQPPSVRGTSGKVEVKPVEKKVAASRPARLNVPGREE